MFAIVVLEITTIKGSMHNKRMAINVSFRRQKYTCTDVGIEDKPVSDTGALTRHASSSLALCTKTMTSSKGTFL